MIKAIITDVDGVIVGDTPGFNFPLPNSQVIEEMKRIHESGIPIVLCTGKGLHPNLPTIQKANLRNPHITDGGGLISDPLDNKTIARFAIPKDTVSHIISYSIQHHVYVEIYYDDAYAIAKNQESETTEIHTKIMLLSPSLVEDLENFAKDKNIIKIILLVQDKAHMPLLTPLIDEIGSRVSCVWSIHPAWLPRQIAVVTAKNTSKLQAAEKVLETLGISFSETLGIGDTPGDWKFMNLCGYVGVTGADYPELMELAKSKGEGKYCIASSVEKNGILEIFTHFNL